MKLGRKRRIGAPCNTKDAKLGGKLLDKPGVFAALVATQPMVEMRHDQLTRREAMPALA